MPLTFPEELLIGVDEVDAQHRSLYDQINRLHEAMRSHALAQVTETIDFLARYVSEHFGAEERLMIEAGYPGFPEHIKLHGQFRKDLKGWQARLAAEGPSAPLVVDLADWVTRWLSDHIRHVDAKMAGFLRKAPVER